MELKPGREHLAECVLNVDKNKVLKTSLGLLMETPPLTHAITFQHVCVCVYKYMHACVCVWGGNLYLCMYASMCVCVKERGCTEEFMS